MRIEELTPGSVLAIQENSMCKMHTRVPDICVLHLNFTSKKKTKNKQDALDDILKMFH